MSERVLFYSTTVTALKRQPDGLVQVNGIAPFVVNFVGPDNSRPAKKMD